MNYLSNPVCHRQRVEYYHFSNETNHFRANKNYNFSNALIGIRLANREKNQNWNWCFRTDHQIGELFILIWHLFVKHPGTSLHNFYLMFRLLSDWCALLIMILMRKMLPDLLPTIKTNRNVISQIVCVLVLINLLFTYLKMISSLHLHLQLPLFGINWWPIWPAILTGYFLKVNNSNFHVNTKFT